MTEIALPLNPDKIPEVPDGFKLTVAQDKAMQVLISDATYIALGGGARSGKTFLLVRAVIVRALKAPKSRHAIFRFRFNALWASVVLDTLPKVIELCFPELPSAQSMINGKMGYMTLPNESEIWFGGLDDKERTEKILGMEFATLYFNEASQIPYQSFVLACTRLAQKTKVLKLKCYVDFNPPSKKHWTYKMFIEKREPQNNQPLAKEFNYGFFLINPMDNKENLDPEFLATLEALPEKARNRFLLGRFADDSEGALWTDELLAQNRVLGQQDSLPEWLRIVVSVDPSGCRGEEDYRSDEIGITVCALGTDNDGYLLEDLSGRYSPEEWAKVAVEAYRRHKADRVVGERNFGGDMVRSTIHAYDAEVPFLEVTASRGKVVRAEPIAALYEMKRIHHVGYFPELEDQMCAMTTAGYMGIKSPDRVCSSVWGFTDLFPGMTSPSDKDWRPPRKIVQSRSASRFDRGGRRGRQ